MHGVCVCVCAASCTFFWSRSLQGSNRLQHALQFTTVVKRRHVAATSNTLLSNEHTRDLRSHQHKKKHMKQVVNMKLLFLNTKDTQGWESDKACC